MRDVVKVELVVEPLTLVGHYLHSVLLIDHVLSPDTTNNLTNLLTYLLTYLMYTYVLSKLSV